MAARPEERHVSARRLAGWAAAVALAGLAVAPIATAWAQEVQRISAAGERAIVRKPWDTNAGAADPDVIIVEYFDYNCGYCKRFTPTLQAVLADRRVTVIYKDWPILGAVSVYAARAVLATRWQGRYLAAHDALMSGPHLVKPDQVDGLLQAAGVDMGEMQKDREAHGAEIDALLTRVDSEARALELQGTPGIVVGRQLVSGITDLQSMRQYIEVVRREKREKRNTPTPTI
jgi:protein-disulfide isomerase